MINKQAPASIVVTGPATLAPGATGTFTLTITYANPISTTRGYIVRAAIFEDDVGNALLDRSVHVRFPANASSGAATFELKCIDDGQGNLSLQGDDGSNAFDAVWEVFATVSDQDTSASAASPNSALSCQPPD